MILQATTLSKKYALTSFISRRKSTKAFSLIRASWWGFFRWFFSRCFFPTKITRIDIQIPPEMVFWVYFGPFWGSKHLLSRCLDVGNKWDIYINHQMLPGNNWKNSTKNVRYFFGNTSILVYFPLRLRFLSPMKSHLPTQKKLEMLISKEATKPSLGKGYPSKKIKSRELSKQHGWKNSPNQQMTGGNTRP